MSKNSKIFEKVKQNAREHNACLENINVYIDNRILEPGHVIGKGHLDIEINEETVLVFVDDSPHHHWGHPCRYLLFNAKTGELSQEIKSRFPPFLCGIPDTFECFHELVSDEDKPDDTKFHFPEFVEPIFPNYDGERYALLFSGSTEFQHLNDMEFIYRILVNIYGFKKENIRTLNYDGTLNYSAFKVPDDKIWPKDNTPYQIQINASGTCDELDNALDTLAGKLKKDDLLFIHTNNHGRGPTNHDEPDSETESSLLTYDACCRIIPYYASRFGAKLAALPEFKELIVLMEQCHSGGFKDFVLNNSTAELTTFMAACKENCCSRRGKNFDPFSASWFQRIIGLPAIPGETEADLFAEDEFLEDDLFINPTIEDAFALAEAASEYNPDTPVIGSKPDGCEKLLYLGVPDH